MAAKRVPRKSESVLADANLASWWRSVSSDVRFREIAEAAKRECARTGPGDHPHVCHYNHGHTDGVDQIISALIAFGETASGGAEGLRFTDNQD